MKMKLQLKKHLVHGSRAVLRDNFLCKILLRNLRKHEKLSVEEIHLLRLRLLYKSLMNARERLPYYKDIPASFSLHDSLRILSDCVPVITKDTLIENKEKLYPNFGVAQPWYAIGQTSGTTGSPLSVFRSPYSVLFENATINRHWSWGGFEEGMKRAALRGVMVADVDQTEPPFWFHNVYNNQLLLSSRHLKEQYVDAIIDRIESFAPSMLQAYPSTAFTLASYLESKNRFLHIPVVYLSSEPLYLHQRELIASRMNCKVMEAYGMAERVAYATECEFGELHINPDYSHVEILDDNDKPTDDYGFLAGTTFHNRAMPLLRYKLADQTRWKPGPCLCGRPFPIIEKVSGKFEDTLTTNDGAPVSASVLTFAFKGVDNIRKSQVAQISPDQWEVRIIPRQGFTRADQEKLLDNIHRLVDANIHIRVALKDDLPETAAGKFRWVVNEDKSRRH